MSEPRITLAREEAETIVRLLAADDEGAIALVLVTDGEEAVMTSATTSTLTSAQLAAFVRLLGDERDRLAGLLSKAIN